jgi:hypothetical protein
VLILRVQREHALLIKNAAFIIKAQRKRAIRVDRP